MHGKTIFLCLIFFTCAATAQEPSGRVFRVETHLREVEVRVTGRDGKPVRGLKKDDFNLKVSGRRQQVATLDFVETPEQASSVARLQENRPPEPAIETSTPQHRTWIYIDTEVDANEINQTYKAIRQFLADQLRPGFMVSLGGLPFSDDKNSLLSTLDQMQKKPFGHPPDLPAMINPVLTQEKAARLQWLVDAAGVWRRGASLTVPGFADLTLMSRRNSSHEAENPADNLKRTEEEMDLYVQIALFRYLDLVHRIEGLPGKKVVILLRSGMGMDKENTQLMSQVAEAAERHRVGFYAIDSRGLYSVNGAQIKEDMLNYGINPQPLGMDSTTDAITDMERIEMLRLQSDEGLNEIANLTGGKALAGYNDLHVIFDSFLKDASDYYVLGFYPADETEKGRFRSLKVAVDLHGVKVQAPQGYFEPVPVSVKGKPKQDLSLLYALGSTPPGDFPVAAGINFFRGSDGRPVAVLSTGVRPEYLAAREKGKDDLSVLDATVLTEIKDAASTELPVFRGKHTHVSLNPDELLEAKSDSSVLITYNAQIPLSPGKYEWRIVFRDDNSGSFGVFETPIEVPDYRDSPALSTLLLTRQVAPNPGGGASAGGKVTVLAKQNLLEAEALNFFPQPVLSFRQGETIHMLCDLYNPHSYDFDAIAGQMQSRVLLNKKRLGNMHIDWRFIPGPENNFVRFAGTLDTTDLPPGDYEIEETIPDGVALDRLRLSANFIVRPK